MVSFSTRAVLVYGIVIRSDYHNRKGRQMCS